jgi:hypothetical protein
MIERRHTKAWEAARAFVHASAQSPFSVDAMDGPVPRLRGLGGRGMAMALATPQGEAVRRGLPDLPMQRRQRQRRPEYGLALAFARASVPRLARYGWGEAPFFLRSGTWMRWTALAMGGRWVLGLLPGPVLRPRQGWAHWLRLRVIGITFGRAVA